MTKHNPRFGPLTFGVLLGASIGLAVAAFGLCTLHAGGNDNDYDSILVVAICAATIGFLLGFAAELLPAHPKLAARPWIRYVIRPISFCSLPYAVLALSLRQFGYDKLMGGLGFWVCIVLVPLLGIAVTFHRVRVILGIQNIPENLRARARNRPDAELTSGDNVRNIQRVAMIPCPPETRASFILRLRDAADVAAWDEFVAIYGPLV